MASGLLPHSPEPLQALAALRFEQAQLQEATKLLRKSVAMWLQPDNDDDDTEMEGNEDMPADATGKASIGEEGGEEQEDMDEIPSLEFRFEAAKLLLELEQKEETELALHVLYMILEENDTIVDVWYLLAVAQVRSFNW